jgi:hypothetical protein
MEMRRINPWRTVLSENATAWNQDPVYDHQPTRQALLRGRVNNGQEGNAQYHAPGYHGALSQRYMRPASYGTYGGSARWMYGQRGPPGMGRQGGPWGR